MIEIKPDNGYTSPSVWGNPFEEEDSLSSRLNTFRTYREYFDYLLWQTPNVVKDGIDASLDLLRAGTEAQELFFNPIYKDSDLPQGDGSYVVIIPGFWGNGFSYRLPRYNLRRLNWDAEIYPVRYGSHIEPTEKMIDPLVDYAREKWQLSGRKIHLIGHSKGGHVVLGTALLRMEELAKYVDQLFIIDAPIPDTVNFQVGVGYLAAQTVFGGNDFRLTRLADDTLSLGRLEDYFRLTTIKAVNGKIIAGFHVGSKEDIFEVDSSHSGALHHRGTLSFIAERLARPVIPAVEGDENLAAHFPQKRAA